MWLWRRHSRCVVLRFAPKEKGPTDDRRPLNDVTAIGLELFFCVQFFLDLAFVASVSIALAGNA